MTVIRDDFPSLHLEGMTVRIAPIGASLASIEVPDRDGRPGPVLLGLPRPRDYLRNPHYLGCTVGRFAGRIGRARFTLDGREYVLPANFGAHQLHGGAPGWSHLPWETPGAGIGLADGAAVGVPRLRLMFHSPDGDQGWPGRVRAAVSYTLEPGHRLRISWEARADAPTHLSLTNHAYFDLSGSGDVSRHRVRLAASRVLELGEDAIPTGRTLPVDGTPMDFRESKDLFRDAPHYDHCFALDGYAGPGPEASAAGPSLHPCAEVHDPVSGRTMTVSTSLPGVQLYTPDFERGTEGHSGGGYAGRAGFCLETQFFPDAPNRPEFPSTRLERGEVWRHETLLEFGTDR